MAGPGIREMRDFVFHSVRSDLAARMIDLWLSYRAAYAGVADFAKRLGVEQAKVALVLIDWTRQGIFRPSMSGGYCFSASPEQRAVIALFRRVWLEDAGRKALVSWIAAIESGKVQTAEELPDLSASMLSPPAPTPASVSPATPGAAGVPAQPSAPVAAKPAQSQAVPEEAAPAAATEFAPQTREDLGKKALAELRKSLSVIPPLPVVAQHLLREAHDPNSSAKSLAHIAVKDPSIVMSLLKTANSAFFGQTQEVTDVQRAIVVIGLNNVRHLLLASGIGRLFKPPAHGRGYDFDALWVHALGVSVAARLLSRRTKVIGEPEAGTLGLLHDIGKFAMNVTAPGRVQQLLDPFGGMEGLGGLAKEVAIFGTTHAIYGSMVLESWQLPNEIARVVEYHHHPGYARSGGISAEVLKGASLVHIANQLAKIGGLECGDRDVETVPEYCFKALGLPADLHSLLDDSMRRTFEQVKFYVTVAGKPRARTAEPKAAEHRPARGPRPTERT